MTGLDPYSGPPKGQRQPQGPNRGIQSPTSLWNRGQPLCQPIQAPSRYRQYLGFLTVWLPGQPVWQNFSDPDQTTAWGPRPGPIRDVQAGRTHLRGQFFEKSALKSIFGTKTAKSRLCAQLVWQNFSDVDQTAPWGPRPGPIRDVQAGRTHLRGQFFEKSALRSIFSSERVSVKNGAKRPLSRELSILSLPADS